MESEIKNLMKNIKYPLVFLFRLFSYKNEINDKDFSMILKIFLKHHTRIALSYNLKLLFNDELSLSNNCNLSWNVLNDFYKIMNNFLIIKLSVEKFAEVYPKKQFWNKSLKNQLEFLMNLKTTFLGIYDCSNGGLPFHYKIFGLLKSLDKKSLIKHEIRTNIHDRLITILKMFGRSLFQALEISLIPSYNFNYISDEYILEYLDTIYVKFNETLNQTIHLFNSTAEWFVSYYLFYKDIF